MWQVLQFLLRHSQVSNISLHIMDTFVSGTLLKLLDRDHKIFTDFMGLNELPMRTIGTPETYEDAALYGSTVMGPEQVQTLIPVERKIIMGKHNLAHRLSYLTYTMPFPGASIFSSRTQWPFQRSILFVHKAFPAHHEGPAGNRPGGATGEDESASGYCHEGNRPGGRID